MAKYEFSAPMPYTIEDIDSLLDINNLVEKGRITSLYAALPACCDLFSGFEQNRNFDEHSEWDYWKRLIEHTLERGCDFIYLLNSPAPLNIDNPDFPQKIEKLEKLLEALKSTGTDKLRIASPQLQSYIGAHHSDFKVYASTSMEYKTIWEYQNFIFFHPEVKQIVPSHDVNKNFPMLAVLREKHPDIQIEIMLNEGCLQGCPHRNYHASCSFKSVTINDDICLSNGYYSAGCSQITGKYPIQSLVIGTHIFPWELDAYVNIGINNFKLVGRDANNFKDCIYRYTLYLKGADDIKYIEDCSLASFVHHMKNSAVIRQMKVRDYKKYMPDINHFVKFGHLCSSRCGYSCRYCYNCAEKMQKLFKKEQKELQSMNISPCTID